jgi:hypothetical protein
VTRSRRVTLAALLLAVLVYIGAAWAIPPGFFDGLAPPGPYRWTSPPPTFRKGNQPPLDGHTTARVEADGKIGPGTAFTRDGQASFSWSAGGFKAPKPGSVVTFRLRPVRTFPNPGPVHLSTNVYCFTSTTPVARGQLILVTLTYAAGVPAPTAVYGYRPGGTAWQRIGNLGDSAPFTISANATSLGCFGAGTEKSSGASTPAGDLPLLVAALIVLVLLAGLPLVLIRLRRPPAGAGGGEPPASASDG